MTLVDQLAKLAMSVEIDDPIDWGMLQLSEESVYRLMSSNVLEMYLSEDKDSREMIMLATTVKLVVENYVLNLKLMESIQNNGK